MEHTNVKILAMSDVPSKALWDYDTRARLEGIDLILSCGDLPKKYLEYLTNFTAAPILYVHGNHDGSYQTQGEPGGCICVDDQVYTWKGLRMGLGGCQRYNKRGYLSVHREGHAPPCAQAGASGAQKGRHRPAADPRPGQGTERWGTTVPIGALSASTRFWTSTSLNGSSTGTYT